MIPPAPIDSAILQELSAALGAEAIVPLLDQLVAELAERVGKARVAIDGGDLLAVRQHAHALKGSAGTMGASRVADICAALEAACRAANAVEAAHLFGDLVAEADVCAAEVLRLRERFHAAGGAGG